LARSAGFAVIDKPDLPLPNDAVNSESELTREILTHLPLARTELGVRTLLSQQAAWEGIERNKQSSARATDQAVVENPTTPHPHFATSPHSNLNINAILQDRSLHWLLHPPRVAIVGAANVGKSTLANRLFAQERSITADLPGTTRDWVGELADINGLPAVLVDTPGLRATSDGIELAAIDRGREQICLADLVVLVLDATRPLDDEQAPLVEDYPQAIHVINKSDRPPAWQSPWPNAIHTIATVGQGMEELRRAIAGHFNCDAMDGSRPRWWTERQRLLLEHLQQGSPQNPTTAHK
jgi:small GTP-binding protein